MSQEVKIPEKAYENDDFIRSKKGRILRIMSEFIEPKTRLEEYSISDTIVFFGSARTLSKEEAEQNLQDAEKSNNSSELKTAQRNLKMSKYYEQARELSYKLTKWSKTLEKNRRRFVVCTGGGPGIMEAANRGASEAKGLNIGFNISLPFEQYPNPWITNSLSFNFHYFFMRKFWFAYLAKAIIVFPGGFGTLDELFEILTLVQTKKIEKHFPIILFGKDYWDQVINMEKLVEFGGISEEDLDLFKVFDDVDECFEFVSQDLLEYSLAKPGDIIR